MNSERTSLRQKIALTTTFALLSVSAVFIAYMEIFRNSLIHRHEAMRLDMQTDFVDTVLNLHVERLGTLAQQVAANPEVDATLLAEISSPDLDRILTRARDTLPERPVIALLAPTGRILAIADEGSEVTDPDIFQKTISPASETRLIVGASGTPILAHHAPVRLADRIAGHLVVLLNIGDGLIEFFPGLVGLAFLDAQGDLWRLVGEIPDAARLQAEPGGPARGQILTEEGGRRLDAVFLPLLDETDKAVGDLVFLRDITAALQRETMWSRLSFSIVLIIILLSLGLQLRALRRGFRPLGAVVQLLETMARGETGLRFRGMEAAPDPDGNHAADAASSMGAGKEISALLGTVERFRASLDARSALIAVQKQLASARRIQQSLLPMAVDELSGICIHGRMRAAQEVGGDFFDIFPLRDGRIVMMIADVSGKGIAAALFAAQASALLRAQCQRSDDPAQVVGAVNVALCERNPEEMFISVILAVITPETGEVCFVNAGHCPPMIADQDREVRLVETRPDPVLGVLPELEWARHDLVLTPGDWLLVYSDGFDEAQTDDGRFLGTDGAMAMFGQAFAGQAELSGERLTEHILGQIDGFAAGAPQADDITLLAIGIPPGQHEDDGPRRSPERG